MVECDSCGILVHEGELYTYLFPNANHDLFWSIIQDAMVLQKVEVFLAQHLHVQQNHGFVNLAKEM